MMKVKLESGECSGILIRQEEQQEHEEPWAKLVPLDSKHPVIEIRLNEMVICSETTFSSLSKHEWCRIRKNPDLCSGKLQNLSLTTVIVDGIYVEKEDTAIVKCGTNIITGPEKGYLSYKFQLMAAPENCQKLVKVPIDSEHAKCSICLHVWHDVVTAGPCFHNFCNGCFSEWLKRSQKENSSVRCPQCRADVHFVGRNYFLRSIEEGILACDLSLKRSNEELAVLDGSASIQSNLVIRNGNLSRRKRPYSPPNEETGRVELPCPQCGSRPGGFQCNQHTSHLQCHACGGMMPARTDISVPQHCLGCDRAFCWAYWREQGVFSSDSYPVCRNENIKPISEYIITRIPLLTHQSNRFEQDITERFIQQIGKTLQNVISDWILKLNNREIDRTRMPLNHAESITLGSYVCNDCYDKLVSFLLYWFRITTPTYRLPSDVSAREDCWYGYACRTQHHSSEHARKKNHVCRPTRGSGM